MNEANKHVIRVSVMKKSKELQKQLKEAQDYLLKFIPTEQKEKVAMKFHSRYVEAQAKA